MQLSGGLPTEGLTVLLPPPSVSPCLPSSLPWGAPSLSWRELPMVGAGKSGPKAGLQIDLKGHPASALSAGLVEAFHATASRLTSSLFPVLLPFLLHRCFSPCAEKSWHSGLRHSPPSTSLEVWPLAGIWELGFIPFPELAGAAHRAQTGCGGNVVCARHPFSCGESGILACAESRVPVWAASNKAPGAKSLLSLLVGALHVCCLTSRPLEEDAWKPVPDVLLALSQVPFVFC